jgi:ABC-type Zn2+ transport system substrate-binding protein/surface adhesin
LLLPWQQGKRLVMTGEVQVCMRTSAHTHTYIQTHTHRRRHRHRHTHTHTHTHTDLHLVVDLVVGEDAGVLLQRRLLCGLELLLCAAGRAALLRVR